MHIRPTTEEEHDLFVTTMHSAFGLFPEPRAEDGGGVWWAAHEHDRNFFAVADDGKLIGTAGAYSFELTLPGEHVIPVAGVSAVGVVPTHRRQGVLTAMMRHQLADVRARGEALAVLLCSEATIYRRYGYGPATYNERLTVQRHRSAFARPHEDKGTVEVLRRDDAVDLMEEIYDRHRRTQPGALSRPHRWWATRAGQPPIAPAHRYIAVHRAQDGTPDGYAGYTVDSGTLSVDETIAVTDEAFTALARYVLDHDLVEKVVLKQLPPGHPLRWRFEDFRAAEASGHGDWLWVRVLDVPRALTARGWFTDGELVLDVDDPFLGERGRYLLTVRDGGAECVRTDRAPDLSLDVSDLGSVYLGGTTPTTLARAGRVQAHHPDALPLADALFRPDRTPHCPHWF
ncbi:GNAT family N-acetyltransferase [Streptomyces roseirectus]|uniref:GNAT family N-acetyltransferase n=1 Tax=Streptomyces roseirectus TaxID=2768066 RepID=A0A7H0IB24_9ACTN|nr:GNAT family N-acetyltransferase [Streptomyces roseirectus]QNP69990.1 GNAT family N-acetyltransferase [Streptomyces roseirectus]